METTSGFVIVEGVQVVVLKSGVFKQVNVYQRSGQLYAATAGGYVSLSRDSVTSVPSIRWKGFVEQTNTDFKYEIGKIGWLELSK